ncbi:MAG: UDP-N-acetylmuramate dehydrogenase [Fusobacteriaceae bacterium]
MKIYKNYEMKEHSNMKVGGITRNYFIVELKEEIKDIFENYSNLFVIGNGTNTLINDCELETNFLSLKNLNKIEENEDGIVKVESGIDFSKLIEYTESKDYTGLENLSGIPGTLGGLVYMNGGAYGSEIFDHIIEIEILDENRNIRTVKKENIDFSYRNTEIQRKKWVVLAATFKFLKGHDKAKVDELKRKREERHPLELPNLGSSFKNPEGHFAAKLIIEAGLQGYTVGDAQISMKHPNFIVNLGSATFEDIQKLVEHVKKEVKEKTGILLDEEIVIVNE